MSRYTGLIMRPGVDPRTAPNKPPLPPADYVREERDGLLTERNVGIPLRDGTIIFADLHRPAGAAGEADLPLLLSWSPYGKHGRSNQVFWPASGVRPEWLSPLTPFEGADPVFWCAAGYAVAVVDPRGAWLSGGDFHHNGIVEAEDCFDAIGWLADQPWSNGKVGMTGVSYLAAIQYLVAPLKPPALAALNPWEGFADWYREFAYHGGIPETGFLPRASDNIQYSLNRTEDTWANVQAHPLIDAYWHSKDLDLEAIETPAYVVASWSDQGLHTRGTIEAYRRISSREKWLEVHGQKKWAHYYRPESRARQHAFFEHFLKARGTMVPAWPRVRLEIRDRAGVATERLADQWPLPETRLVPLWLDAAGTLDETAPAEAGTVRYDAIDGRAVFDHRFDRDTTLAGTMALRLWVEAEGSDDMDLFVALQKLDANGAEVGFTFYAFFDNGPVALGWLRASHRALDPVRSTPDRPFHPHDREERLAPGDIVPVDIEIWASATRFRAGETLRVVVQGSDVYKDGLPRLPFARHEALRNRGTHILHAGGRYDARLLIPLVSE
ncbi:MAG TPA: CocE/NonD family hydrolase [Sphingomonadaceae bacterium]|nr:CocE/NonD family hydrolase [Sphingomonadaceae bacterium]